MIAILNTQGVNEASESMGTDKLNNSYGSHWMALVILPKDSIGLRSKASKDKNEQQEHFNRKDRILLFDSLPHYHPGKFSMI